MRCFVLMGVAGCGKSSVGEALAANGVMTYIDGDDLHPEANVAKMSAGIPLTDADREPWLKRVGQSLGQTIGPVAIGCSALKRRYRKLLVDSAGEAVGFIHLTAPKELIAGRMAARTSHFMPTSLLDSQFADLEPLESDETGWDVDISGPLDDIVAEATARIKAAL